MLYLYTLQLEKLERIQTLHEPNQTYVTNHTEIL